MKKPDLLFVDDHAGFASIVLRYVQDAVRCDTFAGKINIDSDQILACINAEQMPAIKGVCDFFDIQAI